MYNESKQTKKARMSYADGGTPVVMRGGKKVSDYEINGAVRRELVNRHIDLQYAQYRTSNGAVELSGRLVFRETKNIAEVAKELFMLEESVSSIRGVRRVKIEFDDWEKSTATGGYGRVLEGESEEEEDGKKQGIKVEE